MSDNFKIVFSTLSDFVIVNAYILINVLNKVDLFELLNTTLLLLIYFSLLLLNDYLTLAIMKVVQS